MRASQLCFALAACALASGCASFSSSILNRLDDNSFAGNSNGIPCWFRSTRPYKGVPITLQVPSHLDVYIEETYFLETDCRNEKILVEVSTDRLLNVRTEIIKTKKVFMVDLKRPASGSLDSNLSFNSDQYFSSIQGSLTDTTIKDSAALLATVLGALPAKGGGGGPQSGSTFESPDCQIDLMAKTRVVAYKRFDLNAPDYEVQVEAFVNRHLNDCNTCQQFQRGSSNAAATASDASHAESMLEFPSPPKPIADK